ncbi:hypothetical protein ScPMuIL_000082 [Solemya velum]
MDMSGDFNVNISIEQHHDIQERYLREVPSILPEERPLEWQTLKAVKTSLSSTPVLDEQICDFEAATWEELQTITKAKHESGLKQVLINTWPGTLENGDLGLAALPNRMTEFREKLELSIQYAKALDCERMHVMAGRKPKYEDEAMEEVYLDNLQYSADRLQRENILALIEPINSRITEPNYFLTDIHKAIEYIKKVNHPNLKLMFDCFHIQIMDGNLTKNIKQYLPYIGHIQIASVPDRGEPVDGEIDYQYFFKMLDEVGYEGYIGLEYKPRGRYGKQY